jgi:hypothetical protein
MTKSRILDLAKRRGLCVYEQYEGRKIFYKVRIPVFTDRKEIPTGYNDEIVRNPKEVKEIAERVWEDDKYRLNASNWLRKY